MTEIADVKTPELIAVQREVGRKRREFARSGEGSTARALSEAMGEYFKMRQAGVSQDDACKGLELVLRDCFPKGREKPWQYLCAECSDSGAVVQRCPTIRCQRDKQHDSHEYIVPCHCPKGDRFREKYRAPDDAVLEAAAKPRKRSGWSRPGQR